MPSEQAFSVAGDIVTKKRNRMVGSTIKLLMLTVTILLWWRLVVQQVTKYVREDLELSL